MGHTWADLGSSYYSNEELSLSTRVHAEKQTKFLAAVNPAKEFNIGKRSGDSVAIALRGRITTLATTALLETQKVSLQEVPEYDTKITVYRYGLGVNYTGLRKMLDRLSIEDQTVWALKDNAARTKNSLIRTALVAARSFTYVPTAAGTYTATTTATPGAEAAVKNTAFHVRKVVKYLKDNNVPTFDGKNILCIGSTTFIDDLWDDTAATGITEVKKYDNPSEIMEGEVGMYRGVRFLEDNDVADGSIGAGDAFGEAFYIGGEGLQEVMVNPLELLANTNYGGTLGEEEVMAWTELFGLGGTFNYTSHGEGHILHYTST